MAMIFMSYRREDAASMAGWIHEKLQTRYGKSSVFRDIDQIEPGADFEKAIGKALKKADIFIALIGRNWLGRDSNGESRINSETDWIRLETQMALTLGIPILPILVEGAEMPSPAELPDRLKELSRQQALPMKLGRDMDVLFMSMFTAIDRLAQKTGDSGGSSGRAAKDKIFKAMFDKIDELGQRPEISKYTQKNPAAFRVLVAITGAIVLFVILLYLGR